MDNLNTVGIDAPHGGSNFADPGCGNSPSCITDTFLYQDLTTVAGRNYTLTFWLDLGTCGGVCGGTGGSQLQQFQAWFDGIKVFDTGVITNNNTSDPGWVQQTFSLTASTTTTRLEFFGWDDPARIGLDDVSVDTPEPSTVVLLGMGLGALVAIARRRRTTNSTL